MSRGSFAGSLFAHVALLWWLEQSGAGARAPSLGRSAPLPVELSAARPTRTGPAAPVRPVQITRTQRRRNGTAPASAPLDRAVELDLPPASEPLAEVADEGAAPQSEGNLKASGSGVAGGGGGALSVGGGTAGGAAGTGAALGPGGAESDLEHLIAVALERIRAARHYPELARRRGIEGVVRLRFAVGTDGRATNVELVRRVDPLLDEAALEALHSAAPLPRLGQMVEVDLRFFLYE